MSNDERALWYVVHTYSGYENKVASSIEKMVENRGLEHYIFDIEIPVEHVSDSSDKDAKEVERKLFPSYVLIKMIMNDESWHAVRNTRGVTGFVGPGSKPVPLSDAEVEALGVEVHVIEVSFNVGDSIKINDGPMVGFTGIVDEISPDKRKVKATVSFMGRDTAVELETTQVSSID